MRTSVNNLSISHRRCGATIVYTAVLLVIIFGMAAFAVEVGMMMVARTSLQSAADSAALAGASVLSKGRAEVLIMAKQYASSHDYLQQPVQLSDQDIKIGFWDDATRTFTENADGNALEVVARVDQGGLVFGGVLGQDNFSCLAKSVAMAPARDIVFVVDLSGSMNDDSEPAWATTTINNMYASTPYAGVGTELVQDLFTDLGYGSYPGLSKSIGYTLGVVENDYAYAELTKDLGPLNSSRVAMQYRIGPSDTEMERKIKCYSYLIDQEIANVIPNALPIPNSSTNYAYWAKYLDYLLTEVYIHSPVPPPDDDESGGGGGGGGGGNPVDPGPEPPAIGLNRLNSNGLGGQSFRLVKFRSTLRLDEYGAPPVDRGWIPPWESYDRIYGFNNPNTAVFPGADSDTRYQLRNKISYLTYVQFMLDFGRDDKPDGIQYTPLSIYSPDCPLHQESTDGGNFLFPPRTQPMHSCRRALISALKVIQDRNNYSSPDQKDRVAIMTFDRLSNGTTLVQSLTDDYQAAMQSCTMLQACADKGQSTATELGLKDAREYVQQERDGGEGRNSVNKVVVLLTDGLPNAYVSSVGQINSYRGGNPNSNFYAGGYHWLDAPLMQTKIMSGKGWQVYPVGIGLGTDYQFMDRLARMGGTAQGGQSLRGSGNPAVYEATLRELFREIVEDPLVNLVQ